MPDNVNGFSEEQKALFGEAMALIEEGTRKYLEGRYPEVETLYKKALSIWQETTGRESPQTLATMHNLANLYYMQAKYDQAIELYKAVLDMRERELGTSHPDLLEILKYLGQSYFQSQLHDEAEDCCRKAVGESVEDGGGVVRGRKEYRRFMRKQVLTI